MKFLSTFTDYPFGTVAGTLRQIPKLNGLDIILKEFTVGVAGANADTYTLTLESDLKDYVPLAAQAYTQADPSVRQTTLGITSHNQATGVTVLTSTGVIAAGSKVTIMYVRAS